MLQHSAGDRAFGLNATAAAGCPVSLELPRSFRGALTIHGGQGGIKFSREVEPLVATFAVYDDVRKCFVGEQHVGQDTSAIDIAAPYGRVKVRFVDEVDPPRKSWFGFGK